MAIKITFSIEASGTGLSMRVDMPDQVPQNPTAADEAALELAEFLHKSTKIWLDTKSKTLAQCQACVDSDITWH